jgi:hypothetical protein
MITAGYSPDLRSYYIQLSGEVRLTELDSLPRSYKLYWEKGGAKAVMVKARL